MPIFDNDKDRKKLNKQFDKMHLYISRAILNDQGSGSIFQNILKINDEMSARLDVKIDLTKQDQLAEGAKETADPGAKQRRIRQHQENVIQNQVADIERRVLVKFKDAERDFDNRMVNCFKENEKQKDEIIKKL